MSEKDVKVKYEFEVEVKKCQSYGFGYRHVQVLLVGIFIAIAFIMRVNMSVAIVAMTDKTQNSTEIEIFNWSKKTQDIILSSFFWGYTTMQIPVGYLCERFGTKPLFTFAIMVNGIVTLATPLAVHWGGWIAMCVCRSLQGISQSCVFPGTMVIASRWIPNQERSRLTNAMFSGITLGTVAGMPLASLLASTSHGWPSLFYIIGSIAISFGIVWICFSASDPASHKSISEDEKEFISENIGFSHSDKKRKLPWKHILTSLPVYAIQVAQIGSVWVGNTVIMEMPSYMNKILGINMRESGLYSALPFLAMWMFSMVVSVISDWITNNKICSTINSRRIFNTFGTWVPGILLIILTYIPHGHPFIVIGFFVFTASFLASINMGFMMSFIDIAPNYSGSILGITNFVSQALGIFAPIVVGIIVTNETDPKQWQTVFFITSTILIACNLFYISFISTEVQPWNNMESEKSGAESTINNILSACSEEELSMLKHKEVLLQH